MEGKTIQESVAEKILGSGPVVKDTVITKLAQVEIDRRIDLISKAIAKQDLLEKELKKIDKNDVVNYTGGSPVEMMSKARFDQIKKDKERLTKFTQAINTALESNTTEAYTKLTEALNKVNNVGGNQKESSGEDE